MGGLTLPVPRTPECRQKALAEAWEIARQTRTDCYVHRHGQDFVVTRYPLRQSQTTGDMREFTAVSPHGNTREYTPEE